MIPFSCGVLMTNYEKGRRFEYRVRDLFKKHGFVVIRAAQSKPIDLVCLKDGKSILVECKTNKKALNKNKKKELLTMAINSKAIPILAYREKRKVRLLNVETDNPFSLLSEAQ